MEKDSCGLETERLVLRPWRETDAEALFRYASHPAVGTAAGWPPHASVQESREIIRTVFSAPEVYAVVLKETGEPVGSVGFLTGGDVHSGSIGDGEAEIGYWIGVPYWGCGLMPEAVRCLLRWGFTVLGLRAVWCGYYDGNVRSYGVQKKCGFVHHHTECIGPSAAGGGETVHFSRLTLSEWAAREGVSAENMRGGRLFPCKAELPPAAGRSVG